MPGMVFLRSPLGLVVAGIMMASEPMSREALLKQYCVQCHNPKLKTGNLTLEGLSSEEAARHPDTWEKIVRKLESGEMPPPKLPRPTGEAVRAFMSGITSELDAAARLKPYAGKPLIRRLNRTEYMNAVRDLLAIDLPLGRRGRHPGERRILAKDG